MALSLYNTNVRRKQVFIPLDVMHISMYVCGPTVYDLAHIGNARPIIVFDVLYRLLRHIYGKESVTYVRNITDVDDKINEAARLSGKPISAITESTITAFHADISELNTLLPNFEPRATEHIDEMIEIIEELIARGHAYESKNHVMFNVPSYKDYGKLSNRNRDEMLAGARVEVAPYKKDPADFILWKPSDETQPGWESPWGIGRPGWHIECSAMSRKHLGKTIDIHGGGADLIFPHHENEIAQSQCSCPEHDFVRYWVHNGFLTVDGEKMSKSLGNFITIREALTNTPGETLRLMMLSTHYRKPLDWTQSGLRQAHEILDYCYKALWVLQDKGDASLSEDSIPDRTIKILSDDLNTPLAISEMRKVAGQLHRASTNGDKKLQARLASELLATGHFLGVLYENPRDWFQGIKASKSHSASKSGDTEILIAESEIAEKMLLRKQAREKKEFAEADIIRDELANLGVILEDSPDGKTSWRRI